MLIRRFHHQILSKDSLLRPHLRSWDERYQDVLNQVNLHKLHCGTGGDRRASSSNEPGEGGVADGGCGDAGDDYGNDDDDGGGDDCGNDDDDGVDGNGGDGDGHRGWNKGVCCPICKPPTTAR